MLSISEHLGNNSDWSRKAKEYISSQAQENTTKFNTAIAEKLAVSCSNAEQSLIAGIELAREGYFICSLSVALRIIKQKELTIDDRLDACMAVLEKISTRKPAFGKEQNTNEINKEFLCASKFNQEIIKILKARSCALK